MNESDLFQPINEYLVKKGKFVNLLGSYGKIKKEIMKTVNTYKTTAKYYFIELHLRD